MANLRVELHPKQTEVFNDNHRFKVVAAGKANTGSGGGGANSEGKAGGSGVLIVRYV